MLREHLEYLADPVRLERYRAAIGAVVKPGMRVVDLGCGTGVLGLMCLQAGASRVYAIDSTDMIEVARETLERAGFGAQSEFFQGHSSRVVLPERADLVVCDQVGYFGIDYGIVSQYRDAGARFLKPGASLLPGRISLHLAAVESPDCYAKVRAWAAEPVPAGLHWLLDRAVNAKYDVRLGPAELISRCAALATIDLSADNPAYLSWNAGLVAQRDGWVHGLGGWFDCELAQGVRMTNSPLADDAVRRPQAFLPLAEPVQVQAGEAITVKIMARPADDLLAWAVRFPRSGRRFAQSTWTETALSARRLSLAGDAARPRPTAEGRARSTVLGYCDGRRSARDIEQIVLARHPDLLPSTQELSRFVAQTIARYCEP